MPGVRSRTAAVRLSAEPSQVAMSPAPTRTAAFSGRRELGGLVWADGAACGGLVGATAAVCGELAGTDGAGRPGGLAEHPASASASSATAAARGNSTQTPSHTLPAHPPRDLGVVVALLPGWR